MFYADISEFQPTLNTEYPHPVVALRIDNGSRLDVHFAANHHFCQTHDEIHVELVYVVYIPGRNTAVFNRVKSALGSKCPPKVCFMIDMESGAGFAGPGDHSAGANALATMLVGYAGDRRRVVGYANGYDWKANWPNRPSWLKRVTAAYGTQDPGTWGWQYYGGLDYATPPGYPRSCPPFGRWVDMNVVHRDLAGMKHDLGLETEFTMDAEAKAAFAALNARIDKLENAVHPNAWNDDNGHAHRLETFLRRIPGYNPIPKDKP